MTYQEIIEAIASLPAYALPDNFMQDEVIIGRNILNRYVINLDGRNGVFTIS